MQEDITFVVGGKEYKYPRVTAGLLSPLVRLSHSVDLSITEYVIETPDLNGEFQLFMSLVTGSTIEITQSNRDFFVSLSREFGNSDLYASLMRYFTNDFLRSQLDNSTLNLFDENLIGRIAFEFSGLIDSELDGIPLSVLFHILSHNLLRISSEDELFCYINSRLCSDAEYSNLLQFVRFEYVSADSISCLLSILPESIDRRLWESISRGLILQVPHEVEFPLKEFKSFEGIISYLTVKHGGNVQDKGIVTITAKSVYSDDPRYALVNIADLTSVSYFCSTPEPGQWICWNFRENRVRPTHYTIKSRWNRLKSWLVESSQDGENWTEIDRRTDNWDMNGEPWTASFAVCNSVECHFIRLTQTGKNHYDTYHLSIDSVEFFGTLLEQ
jgi:hypothetical protein